MRAFHELPWPMAAWMVMEFTSEEVSVALLEPWEAQSALFVLGYTHDLAPEGQIAAAIDMARADRLTDLDQLLGERFGADVVSRGLALELSRRRSARGRAKSLPDTTTDPKKGAA